VYRERFKRGNGLAADNEHKQSSEKAVAYERDVSEGV
jgi:hypothetical protein